MTNITSQNLAFNGIVAQDIPCEGPRSCPVTLPFANDTVFTLDLSSVSWRNFISAVQSVFVDNSMNPSPLTINFPSSGQSITIGANSQAYLLSLCPNPAKIMFASQGGVTAYVFLLNYPVSNAVWKCI